MSIEAIRRRYDERTLAIFLTLFHHERDWLSRIVETCEVHRTTIRRSVSLTVTIPYDDTAGNKPLLVPVVRSARGVLIDNFDVEDEAGRSLPVLSRLDTAHLARVLMEAEVGLLFPQAADVLDAKSTRRQAYSLSDLLWLARFRWLLSDIPTVHAGQAPTNLVAAIDENRVPVGLPSTLEPSGDFDRVHRLAKFLVDRTFRVVELRGARPGETRIIKYSYDGEYEYLHDSEREAWLARVRRGLGVRPYTFTIDVPLVFGAPSYHLRMRAPTGHYCYQQDLRVLRRTGDDQPPARRRTIVSLDSWKPPRGVDYQGAGLAGRPYAHLYINGPTRSRPTPSRPRFDLRAQLIFFEYPPGHQGTAFAFTGVTALVLAVLALFFRQVADHAEIGALFLGGAGAIAVWMRPTFDTAKLLQAPLSARLGLLVAGAASLLGALDLLIASSVNDLNGPPLYLAHGVIIGAALAAGGATAVLWRRLRGSFRAAALAGAL